MNEDFHSAAWVDNHGRVTAAIRAFLRHAIAGYVRLNDRQFAAPWRPRHRHRSAALRHA